MQKSFKKNKLIATMVLLMGVLFVLVLFAIPTNDVLAENNVTNEQIPVDNFIDHKGLMSIYNNINNVKIFIPESEFHSEGIRNNNYGNYGYIVEQTEDHYPLVSGYYFIYQFKFEYDRLDSMIKSSIHVVMDGKYTYNCLSGELENFGRAGHMIKNAKFYSMIIDKTDFREKSEDTPFITSHINEFNANKRDYSASDVIGAIVSTVSPVLGLISPTISAGLTAIDIISSSVSAVTGTEMDVSDGRTLVANYPTTKEKQIEKFGKVVYEDYYSINDESVYYKCNYDNSEHYLKENGYSELSTRVSNDNFIALLSISFDFGNDTTLPKHKILKSDIKVGKVIDNSTVDNVGEYFYDENNSDNNFISTDASHTLAFENKKAKIRFTPERTGYYNFTTANSNISGSINDEIGKKTINDKCLCLAGKEYVIEFQNNGNETFDICYPKRIPYIDVEDSIYRGVSFIEYMPKRSDNIHIRFNGSIQLLVLDADLVSLSRGTILGDYTELAYNFEVGKKYYIAIVNNSLHDYSDSLEIGVSALDPFWELGNNGFDLQSGRNYIKFVPNDGNTYYFNIDGSLITNSFLANENFALMDTAGNVNYKTLKGTQGKCYYLIIDLSQYAKVNIDLYKSNVTYDWYIDGKKVVNNANYGDTELPLNNRNELELERGVSYKIEIKVGTNVGNYIFELTDNSNYNVKITNNVLNIDNATALYGTGFYIKPINNSSLKLKILPKINIQNDTTLSTSVNLKNDTADIVFTSKRIFNHAFVETQNIKLNINNAVYSISSNNGIFNYHHVIKDVGEECTLNIYIEELTITTREHQSMVINVSEKGKKYNFGTIFAGGNGTENSPYQIYTPRQFINMYAFSGGNDNAHNCFKLMAYIDLTAWEMPSGFKILSGKLYGNSKIVKTNKNIFEVNEGEIHNLLVTYNYTDSSLSQWGITAINLGLIKWCVVQGTMNSNSGASGICDLNGSEGVIEYCTVQASITNSGNVNVGGIAALNYGTINNCVVTGSMKLSTSATDVNFKAGGIVGRNEGTVRDCNANQAVRFTGPKSDSRTFAPYIGGAIGENVGTVSNCKGTADKGELRVVKWGVWPFNNGSWDQAQNVHNN